MNPYKECDFIIKAQESDHLLELVLYFEWRGRETDCHLPSQEGYVYIYRYYPLVPQPDRDCPSLKPYMFIQTIVELNSKNQILYPRCDAFSLRFETCKKKPRGVAKSERKKRPGTSKKKATAH